MSELASNQAVIAVDAGTATALLTKVIKNINGQKLLLNSSGSTGQFSITLFYQVTDVVLRFHSPLIVFDALKIDTTFLVNATVDLNKVYDAIPFLPPRCIEACVPFTDWCVTTCFDLPTISFPLPVPLSFNLAAVYRPRVKTSDDEFIGYPEIDSVPAFLVDPVAILERVCHALGERFPWPLSLAAEKICDLFGQIFGFFEDQLAAALNILVTAFFDATGGWIGAQLTSIKLFHLNRHVFPGSGQGQIPAIPVQLNNLEVSINSADELQASFVVLPVN
jgi:hypothetical protein